MSASTPTRRTSRRATRRRPLVKSPRLWVPVGVVALLAGLGVAGALVGNRVLEHAETAKSALERAVPLANEVKAAVIGGDTAAAEDAAARMHKLTEVARTETSGGLWTAAEAVPFIGHNLTAVRETAAAVDDLVSGAVVPAASLGIGDFAPVDGRIDVAKVAALATTVADIGSVFDDAQRRLAGIDRDGLVAQVESGLDRVDAAISEVAPQLEPLRKASAVLPAALGADGPRNYLVMVQNNAESRGTGGNPAALVMLTVTDGAFAITEQASSGDFHNGRAASIIPLDPPTVELHTDKLGRNVQDVTITADFGVTAELIRAFWAESFGTAVDAVVSIDPVALSYLLGATGPVTLPNGDVLSADNAVRLLLNEVYFRYPDPDQQDAYFAAAARAVFEGVTTSPQPRPLIDALVHAADEGRVLFAPANAEEESLLGQSRVLGKLPTDNAETTLLASYVNDVTEGKLDYYLDTSIALTTDVCTVADDAAPTFTIATTLTSTLQPDQVADLAWYISPGRFFPKGVTSTDLVVYGPVGSTAVGATVDGAPTEISPVGHLGRPAVKINVVSDPASVHTVSVMFSGVAGEDYGPLDVWHTPMVHSTPVTVDTPGCASAG